MDGCKYLCSDTTYLGLEVEAALKASEAEREPVCAKDEDSTTLGPLNGVFNPIGKLVESSNAASTLSASETWVWKVSCLLLKCIVLMVSVSKIMETD